MSNLMPYRFNRHPLARAEYPFFDDFFRPFFSGSEAMPTAIRVDVKDEGDHYLLEADMPGFKKEDVRIEVDDGVLTISAETNEEKKDEQKANYLYNERRRMKVSRSFSLNGIDEAAISAACDNGVLKLTLPKQAEVAETKRLIEVK